MDYTAFLFSLCVCVSFTPCSLEYPSSKKAITEEDMSHYLEQLRLAAGEVRGHQPASSSREPLPLVLQERLAAEDQDDSSHAYRTTPSPRKRCLDYEEDGRMEVDEDDGCNRDSAEADAVGKSGRESGQWKRFRLDGVSSFPTFDIPTDLRHLHLNFSSSVTPPMSHSHSNVKTSPVLVPPCATTRLSSIPEVAGRTDEGEREGKQEEEEEEVTAGREDEGDEEEERSGAVKGGPLSCRIWIAPEVQSLYKDQMPLLPTAVVKEL